MFDTLSVSGDAGLEQSDQDYEANLEAGLAAELEAVSGPSMGLPDLMYEEFLADVAVVDVAMVDFNGAHLSLVDSVIEADHKKTWLEAGSPSLAEWLIGRYRMTRATGRALAKIAGSLPELPCIRRAFASGRLSWDQLKAVVSVATPETDAELAEKAAGMNPAEIRAIPRVVNDEAVDEARYSRYVTYQFNDDEPIFEMRVVLPDDEGATFITALTRKAGQIDLRPHDGGVGSHAERLADALIQMGSETLAADTDHDRATLLVKTDIPTLLGVEGATQASVGDGTTIPAGTTITNPTLQRLACDARIQLVVENPDGGVIGIGRTSRTIPPWLNRIIRNRDKGCRFPQCERTLWLHAHHIKHWADGGPTNLDNLITLCGYHHRLIHHDNWTIEGNPNQEVTWITKWGTEFEQHPRYAGIEAIKRLHANPMPIKPHQRTA